MIPSRISFSSHSSSHHLLSSIRVCVCFLKMKGQWMYLYRAVDSEGNTIDFTFSKTREQLILSL
nr:DDE-type integrase/transposase/recombinase [Bacillus thuringiensis]